MQENFEVKENAQSLSVEELFLNSQESYEEAQIRSQEENKGFSKTEFFRMDKLGVYRLRILPVAPNPDGTIERKSYEYPVRQILLEIEKPSTGNKPSLMYLPVPRATDAGFPVDIIDTYRKLATQAAKDLGDDKLAEKIAGGSFGGGLKYNYGHALYILDLDERAKGLQLLNLSHSQYKDLDERKFKLWQKKLAKNPGYPCPISSVQNAYPVEIEKKKNGSKTEYTISIDNESDMDILSKEELSALMNAPHIPEVVYRYTRYAFEATIEFLKQCDEKYNLNIMELDDMKEAIETLREALPKDDTSSFSFDKRTKDAKENAGGGISLDDILNRLDELQDEGLGDKTEEGQELRTMIRSFIEQEKLSIRVTRSTTNAELVTMIEESIQQQGADNPENGDPEDEQERPARNRRR